MQHIETIELGSSQSSITFSSIPQDYDDLVVLSSSRTDRTAGADVIGAYLNGDTTTANYGLVTLNGDGSSAQSLTSPVTWLSYSSDNANTANTFSNGSFYLSNYTSSNAKSYSTDSASETNATTAFAGITAGLYSPTSAITSIQIYPIFGSNLVSGCTFSLYGITAGGSGTVTTS